MSDNEITAKNLRVLSHYIDKHVTQDQIDMEAYFNRESSFERHREDFCFTHACLLGHATYCFDANLEQFINPHDWFDIDEFGLHYFPSLYTKGVEGAIWTTKLWAEVFDDELPNDKGWLIENLRNVADELEEMQA